MYWDHVPGRNVVSRSVGAGKGYGAVGGLGLWVLELLALDQIHTGSFELTTQASEITC